MNFNKTKIAPSAIVCEESKLKGDITIGSNTIIHPCATIVAESGPIIIGDNCLIEEQVVIINKAPTDINSKNNDNILFIGSNNVFEVNCKIEAKKIGNNNVFESKSFVGSNVVIPNGCIIGAGCHLENINNFENNTIIYGNDCNLRVAMNPPQAPVLQMDILAKLLPIYHFIRKSNKKSNITDM